MAGNGLSKVLLFLIFSSTSCFAQEKPQLAVRLYVQNPTICRNSSDFEVGIDLYNGSQAPWEINERGLGVDVLVVGDPEDDQGEAHAISSRTQTSSKDRPSGPRKSRILRPRETYSITARVPLYSTVFPNVFPGYGHYQIRTSYYDPANRVGDGTTRTSYYVPSNWTMIEITECSGISVEGSQEK